MWKELIPNTCSAVPELLSYLKAIFMHTIIVDDPTYNGLVQVAEDRGITVDALLSATARLPRLAKDERLSDKEAQRRLAFLKEFISRPRTYGNPNADYSRDAIYD